MNGVHLTAFLLCSGPASQEGSLRNPGSAKRSLGDEGPSTSSSAVDPRFPWSRRSTRSRGGRRRKPVPVGWLPERTNTGSGTYIGPCITRERRTNEGPGTMVFIVDEPLCRLTKWRPPWSRTNLGTRLPEAHRTRRSIIPTRRPMRRRAEPRTSRPRRVALPPGKDFKRRSTCPGSPHPPAAP